MIHINLLPVKASKKQEAGRQQLVLLALVFLAALGGNYYGYSKRDGARDAAQAKVNKSKQDIAQLDKVIGEVKDITERTKQLDEKLAVLNGLKRNRSGPVKVLDAIQSALPKKVWLTDLSEAGGAMAIQGAAFSHDDLAEFMSDLQNVVDTPFGIGRVVESSGGKSRVELVGEGQVKDVEPKDVSFFFTNIQLKSATEGTEAGYTTIKFSLTCSANYAA